jgi:hypothetical protein
VAVELTLRIYANQFKANATLRDDFYDDVRRVRLLNLSCKLQACRPREPLKESPFPLMLSLAVH